MNGGFTIEFDSLALVKSGVTNFKDQMFGKQLKFQRENLLKKSPS